MKTLTAPQARTKQYKAKVVKFYSDIPAGTVGTVVKMWATHNGDWYRLYFGENLTGQKMYKSFHHSVIEIL